MTFNTKSTILAIYVCFLITYTYCRFYSDTISVSAFRRNKGWMFIDRMAFDQGNAQLKFKLQIKTQNPPKRDSFDLQLAVIPDQKWLEEEMIKCGATDETMEADKVNKPKRQSMIVNEQKPSSPLRTLIFPVRLNSRNQLTYDNQFTLNILRPVTYHVVLRDCSKHIINEYFKKQTKINYELMLKNGLDHHGADQKSYGIFLPILLFLTTIMVWISRPNRHQLFEQGERDWAKILLSIAMVFNFIALLLNYIGYLIYVYGSGEQYGFFDFTYLLFHSLSEVIITCLLVFVAYGWTITFKNDAEFDLYIPLISMLGLINLILTLLGKVNDGESDKYHMYDTIPSYLLVFFRVVTVAILIIGVVKTYRQNKSNKKILTFYTRFSLLGGSYFLSLPAIMIIATFLPVESRKVLVFFAVELVKNGVNLGLTWMVSSKRSMYSSIKTDSTSFMQKDDKLL